MTLAKHLIVAGGIVALGAAGCDRAPPPKPELQASVAAGEKKSIFRPEFQTEEETDKPLPALEERVLFPEGTALNAAAEATLEAILASPQAKGGGAVTLGGHSDSGGNDAANLRASRARAEAVRDWLVAHGIAADRITLTAFGEQNPVAPNALPDGSPNQDGRAANRRVEIRIASLRPPEPDRPTLAEELASPLSDPVEPVREK